MFVPKSILNMSTFKVHDESLNSYGFWILTSGIDLSDFKKNPIMLWNHTQTWRGSEDEILPIGMWDNIKIEGNEILADPIFDEDDEFALRIKKKVDKKMLRAASIGVVVLEWSEDPSMLKQGQQRATVTKCKLREISICDIPSNKNALMLYDIDGKAINLSEDGEALPLLATTKPETSVNNSEIKITSKMELKDLCKALGLNDDATAPEIELSVRKLQDKLQAQSVELSDLKKQLKSQKDAEAVNLINAALADKRINDTQKAHFVTLFEKDFDSAKAVLENMTPAVKLSDFANADNKNPEGKVTHEGMTFSELSKKAPEKLVKLKSENFELFKALFNSEYGSEYKS